MTTITKKSIVSKVTAVLATALAASAAGLLASATPAAAASRPYVSSSSADMFWCTSTQAFCTQNKITTVSQNTPMTMVCWRDDRDPFNSSAHSRWFYAFLDNGQEGYFWSPQVANQTPNTPRCDTINWIAASDWAIGHTPQTSTTLTPSGYWAGYCQTFAYYAWNGNGGSYRGQTARAAYDYYNSRGMVKQGRPPRGALVYWNIGTAGHVAVSLGNWRVAGTQSAANNDPTGIYHVNRYGGYLGWAMPQTPTVSQMPTSRG